MLQQDTLTLPASATSIEAVKGKVLINHGEGFQPAARARKQMPATSLYGFRRR